MHPRVRTIPVPFAALLVAVTAVSVARAGDDEAPAASGRILDTEGRPVADALVEFRDAMAEWEEPTVAAVKSGPDGSYRVDASAAFPAMVTCTVSKAGRTTLQMASFRGARRTFRVAPSGSLRLTVRREGTDDPVAGVRVDFWGEGNSWSRYGRTGSDGTLLLDGVPPGRLSWAVDPLGGGLVGGGCGIEAGGTATAEAWLPEGTAISGRVLDVHGEPAVGATVSCGDRRTTTGSSGEYRLPGIGFFRGSPSKWGQRVEFTGRDGAADYAEIVLSPGLREFHLDGRLSEEYGPRGEGAVHGRVLFGDEAVAGVRIFGIDSRGDRGRKPALAVTDGSGRFDIAAMYARGADRLGAIAPDGRMGVSSPLPVLWRGEKPVDIHLDAAIRVRGRVLADGGEPVAGCDLLVMSKGRSDDGEWEDFTQAVQTDDDGRYELPVPPRPLTVMSLGASSGESRVVHPSAGRDVDSADLVLPGKGGPVGGVLRGTVVDAAGRPIPGTEVLGWAVSTVTDPAGKFSLPGKGGFLAFRHRDFVERGLHVGSTGSDLRIVLSPGGVIGGTVIVAKGGRPLRVFRVRVGEVREDDSILWRDWTLRSHGEGRFTVPSLGRGAYALQVRADGFLAETVTGLVVGPEGGPAEVAVALREAGSIEGRVLDGEGRPLPDEDVIGAVLVGARTVEEWPVATSDATGRYRWTGLEPGRYRVRLGRTSREVDVAPGATMSLDLKVE